jgi:lipopolysaccharide export system permease protein
MVILDIGNSLLVWFFPPLAQRLRNPQVDTSATDSKRVKLIERIYISWGAAVKQVKIKRPVYILLFFMYYPHMPFTLYRYIAREVSSAFLLGVVIFTGVLLMGKMLKLADMVVSKGVPLADILLMIVYLIPNFAIITIPMSLLLAVLLAFSRISGDSEIIAIKASGISLFKLLPPILAIALCAYILTALTALYALPMGHSAFKQLLRQSVQQRLSLNLKERVFNSDIPGLLVYIDNSDSKSGAMTGVMIQDERNPADVSTIFAKTGSIRLDESSNRIFLHLTDGSIHQSRPGELYRLLGFNEYDLSVNLPAATANAEKNEIEMTLAELRQNLKSGGFSAKLMTNMGFEIHRRFALPFACFIFAVVAVPLGIQNRRSGKAAGFSLSIATLLLFYIFQSFGKTLAAKGILTPFAAMWLPNLIFLAGGGYLFFKTAREERIHVFDYLVAVPAKLWKRLRTR